MVFQAEVLVLPREGVLDTQGKAVEKTLSRLGYGGLKEVRVGRIVRIKIDAADSEAAARSVEQMCQDMLANDLIETCSISVEATEQ